MSKIISDPCGPVPEIAYAFSIVPTYGTITLALLTPTVSVVATANRNVI